MEILTPLSASRMLHFPNFSEINPKTRVTHLLRCSRDIELRNDLSTAPISMELGKHIEGEGEVDQNQLKPTNSEKEGKKDIWQLFKEAQRNILYLNKQRLLAMEELDKLKAERNSMVAMNSPSELKKQKGVTRDNLSLSSELLLRVDSLVLTGGIGSNEASDIRKLVMHSRGCFADDFHDILDMNDPELLEELRYLSQKSKRNGFHIIHICTEMSPVISISSLASYITGLSRALQRRGNVVEVILPKYACLNLDEVQCLREVQAEFYSYFNGQLHGNKIWTGVVSGIGVTFIQPIHYSSLFNQERVYGYSNDFERFSYFSRASLDFLVKSGKRPDVIHIHNWETSIVGPLFWDVYVNQGLADTRLLLTCQNFNAQCLEQPEKLALCGLDPSLLHRPDRLQDNNKSHLVNILKGGIVYSNKVVIMSSMQPKEHFLNAPGYGLEPTLDIHKKKLVIAPPGLDKATWDPSHDNFLPQCYNAENIEGKSVCKLTVQKRLDLSEEISEILVGCIYSYLSDTDLDKLKTVIRMASRSGVQFAFMRSEENPGMNRSLELFQEEVKDDRVRFIDKYDEELLHLLISGSDIMLCPSFDDPVLHVPLKALNYGTAPVSLRIITDIGFRHFGDQNTEGSKFSQYINSTFGNMSLLQAIDELRSDPLQWQRKIIDSMKKDFSWDAECSDVHISAYDSIRRL